MALVDIEVGLTEQERAIADTVHKFAEEVMRPAGVELDRLADPADVTRPDSILSVHILERTGTKDDGGSSSIHRFEVRRGQLTGLRGSNDLVNPTTLFLTDTQPSHQISQSLIP